MKTLILSTITASAISLCMVTSAHAVDCSRFEDRSAFFTSIGLTDSASFWAEVATECAASDWSSSDRKTVRDNIRTLTTENAYERPDRETVRDAAEAAGVEVRDARHGKRKKGSRSKRSD